MGKPELNPANPLIELLEPVLITENPFQVPVSFFHGRVNGYKPPYGIITHLAWDLILYVLEIWKFIGNSEMKGKCSHGSVRLG
jgi:hypothetical protein